MSIRCTNIEHSPIVSKAILYGAKEFVHAEIDPKTVQHLSLPSDYEYSKCFLTKKYSKLADRIQNFIIRPDDVWIVSFPKCGTTWLMNIVWQLKQNLDFSTDLKDSTYKFLERTIMYDFNDENKDDQMHRQLIERLDRQLDEFCVDESPRLLKSHLPAYLLPKNIWTVKPKLIYVSRDPKDAIVSMYHMYRNHSNIKYAGTMEDFFDISMNDHIVYAPFHDHVHSFVQLKQLDHVLLMKYEEILANPFNEIKRINDFLKYSYSDDQLKQLTAYVSFESMREKYADQTTYRSGFK